MTVELTQQLLGIALARGFTSTFDVTRQLGWPPRSHGREPATEPTMSERFHFEAGAAGYDRGFGSVSPKFIPALLRAAKLTAGQRVLDVATGSGLAAQAACGIVGPSGHVVATDISSSDSGSSAAATCGVGERVTGDRRWSSSEFPRGKLRRCVMQHGLNAISEPRARIVGILPGGARRRARGGLGGHNLPALLRRSRQLRIPTQSGHRFRFEAGHRSDLMPAAIPK